MGDLQQSVEQDSRWNREPDAVQEQFKRDLGLVLDEIETLLLEKNRSYGDSVLNPVRIFSKANAAEQVNVRIDDKLSRIMRGGKYPGDDDELDLIGYLLFRRIGRLRDATR